MIFFPYFSVIDFGAFFFPQGRKEGKKGEVKAQRGPVIGAPLSSGMNEKKFREVSGKAEAQRG